MCSTRFRERLARSLRDGALPCLLLTLALAGCTGWLPTQSAATPRVTTPSQTPARWGDPLPATPSAQSGAAADEGALSGAANGDASASYRIGPEDALEIAVWKDESLKSTVLVRPDGAISFPLIGELAAAGRSASELRDEIARRLARFVPDAEVSVSVIRVASYRVYVIGRVNKPGEFVVGRPIDVLQLLALAGGTTPFAADDEIRIIRRIGGRQVALPFDYKRLRKDGDLNQNIVLRSGDVVLVP